MRKFHKYLSGKDEYRTVVRVLEIDVANVRLMEFVKVTDSENPIRKHRLVHSELTN
jgi:hypothetical protein